MMQPFQRYQHLFGTALNPAPASQPAPVSTRQQILQMPQQQAQVPPPAQPMGTRERIISLLMNGGR